MKCFQIFLLLAFVNNFLIFVGNVNLDKGVATADSALDRMDLSLQTVSDINEDLSSSGANVTLLFTQLEALGCEDAALLAEYSVEFEAVVGEFSDLMSPVDTYVTKSNNALNHWVKERKNHFIWVTFSLNTLCMGLFAWAYGRKSSLGLQLALVLTEVIVVLDMVFGILYMTSLMGASDFCMHPTDYVLAMADSAETQATLSYYSTCTGANPTADFVNDAAYTINVMRYFVSYLGTSSCPDYAYLADQVQWNLDQIYANFNVVTDLSACDTYMPYWNEFFYAGVCSHAFDGMYLIWITQTLCAVCLLGAALCSSSIFPYFFELKKLDFESDLLSEHGEEDAVSSGGDSGVSSVSLSPGRTVICNPMIAPWEVDGGGMSGSSREV